MSDIGIGYIVGNWIEIGGTPQSYLDLMLLPMHPAIVVGAITGFLFDILKLEKLTIIIIEHLMKVLTEISQRLMILHNGEKICIGPPQEVAQDKRVIEVYLGV